jgi:hypothetical protein
MLWHRAYSLMGPLYGSCLLLRGLTLLLGCTACAYGLLVEGPGDALLPTLVLQLALAIRGFVFPPRGWSPALGLLRAMLPALSMSVVWVYWLGWAALPSEMLPSSFFEKNSFLLFGRNFTLYKAVEEKVEEESAIAAVEHIVAATAVGVAVGALSAGLPTVLQRLGALSQAWPPDAVPGYLYETLTDPDSPLAEPYSPRRASAGALRLQLPRAAARTFGLFAEALADELLYRSVLYRYLGVLLSGPRWDADGAFAGFRYSEGEVHGNLMLLPLLVTSLLFATKFLGYRGEFGLGLGLVLQAEMALWDCVLPCVATHGIFLLIRDALRTARPLQKPVAPANASQLDALQMDGSLHMT